MAKKRAKNKVSKKKVVRKEKTSKRVASRASKLLRTSRSKTVKSVAASALTQVPDRKKTPKGTNNTGPRKT